MPRKQEKPIVRTNIERVCVELFLKSLWGNPDWVAGWIGQYFANVFSSLKSISLASLILSLLSPNLLIFFTNPLSFTQSSKNFTILEIWVLDTIFYYNRYSKLCLWMFYWHIYLYCSLLSILPPPSIPWWVKEIHHTKTHQDYSPIHLVCKYINTKTMFCFVLKLFCLQDRNSSSAGNGSYCVPHRALENCALRSSFSCWCFLTEFMFHL